MAGKGDKKTQPGQASLPEMLDPFAYFRQWISVFENQTNEVAEKISGTKEFTEFSHRMLQVKLQAKEAIAEQMEQQLHLMNMPTRTDILSLGDRIGEINDRLIRLERAMASLNGAKPASDLPPMPPRTKKASPGKDKG